MRLQTLAVTLRRSTRTPAEQVHAPFPATSAPKGELRAHRTGQVKDAGSPVKRAHAPVREQAGRPRTLRWAVLCGTLATLSTLLYLPSAALAANQTLKISVTGPGSISANEGTISGCTESGGASCEGKYTEDAKITLTAANNERTAFTGWTTIEGAPGTCAAATSPCEVTVSGAIKLEAKFTAKTQESLTVTNPGAGPGAGTIKAFSPGLEFTPIKCGNGAETCTETYNQGTEITLTATPNERSTSSVVWTGCGTVNGSNECEVTMSAAKSVEAKFTAKTQEQLTVLTTEGTGAGTVTGNSPGGEFTPIDCGNGASVCTETYNQGTKIFLAAAPNERSTSSVVWTGCPHELSPTECEVEMTAAKSVKAEFTAKAQEQLTVTNPGTGPGTGTITGTSPGGEFQAIDCGNGASLCTETYNEGAGPITLTATPNERSTRPIVWTGCDATPSETECEVTMSAGRSVGAKFTAKTQEQLTVLTTEGAGSGTVTGTNPGSESEFKPIECGNGTETCETSYNQGATITLTANRAAHSKFTGWEGCTNVISTNEFATSECEVEMTAAKTVKAKFATIPQAELKVEVKGPGEITSSPSGLSCTEGSSPCVANFDTEGPESTVTLTAAHNERTAFAGWSGSGAGSCATEPNCEVTTSAAKEVKAKFTPIAQRKLTVQAEGPGAITGSQPGGEFTAINCGATCEAEYNEGATLTLTAAASPDNHLEKWEGGGCDEAPGAEPTCEVTMSAAQTVKAVFGPTFHKLRVTPSGPGSVTSSPPGIIACAERGEDICEAEPQEGSTLTLTAAPAAHNHVTWTNCTAVPSENTCKVTIGASNLEVKAAFSINLHTLTVAPSGPGQINASSGEISACTRSGGTCAGPYGEDTTVVLTATPHAHYRVSWAQVDCKAEPEEKCELEIGPSDATVEPSFLPIERTLSVAPSGSGSVHATSGAISHCSSEGGVCSGSYIEAATVTLLASPGSHQAVAWSGCTSTEGNRCEVEVPSANAEVKVTFALLTHTLTLTKAGTGSGALTCNGAPCATAYPEGTVLTLTATPAQGSTFAGWSGGGCSGTGTCHLTLEADTAITATFNANPRPAEEHCVVPDLAGRTLNQASSALSAAHCTRGKVTKPKHKKGKKLSPLVIRSSSPSAGTTLPTASKVNLTLGPKPKKRH